MHEIEFEFLLCGGIASFACPFCKKNIKAPLDDVFSGEPYPCPYCEELIEIDQSQSV